MNFALSPRLRLLIQLIGHFPQRMILSSPHAWKKMSVFRRTIGWRKRVMPGCKQSYTTSEDTPNVLYRAMKPRNWNIGFGSSWAGILPLRGVESWNVDIWDLNFSESFDVFVISIKPHFCLTLGRYHLDHFPSIAARVLSTQRSDLMTVLVLKRSTSRVQWASSLMVCWWVMITIRVTVTRRVLSLHAVQIWLCVTHSTIIS